MKGGAENQINPFQNILCTCVVCEEQARYRKLKTTLYAETRRDIDLRPISILWSKKLAQRVDPKLYYFWQCPFCGFTADHGFFIAPLKEGPMNPSHFRKIFARSRAAHEHYPSVYSLLKLEPKAESSAFLSALKLNLFAIYIWEMIEEFAQGDSLVLGSYYLRLGWQLRDVRHVASKSPQTYQAAHSLIHELQVYWPAINLSEAAMLQQSLTYYKQGLIKSSTLKTVAQEIHIKLIIARLSMKLGHMPDAKQQIIESRTQLASWEQNQKKPAKAPATHGAEMSPQILSKTKTMIAAVEDLYEKVEDSLNNRQAGGANLPSRKIK